MRTIADDIIVYVVGDTEDDAVADNDRKFLTLLERCRQRQVKLNKEKVKLKLSELSYVGHVISAGVKA